MLWGIAVCGCEELRGERRHSEWELKREGLSWERRGTGTVNALWETYLIPLSVYEYD